jgi:hypothetical protein
LVARVDLTRPMRQALRKLFLLAIPAATLTLVLCVLAIEAWVRLSWDHTRGTPGFYLSDPDRGQRLAAGYNGWFAGVPVQINRLGFRDARDYRLEKSPGTFRIVVLGDSVTFGHGAMFETTYPYLLEQHLRSWRPDVGWEVWNLGVPGYNTRQELEYLREIGPTFRPDLVIVGFFPNDFTGNEPASPSTIRRILSAVHQVTQRHLYSYEFFKRLYLTARWRLFTDAADRQRLEHLAAEGELLAQRTTEEQRLTDVDYFDDAEVATFKCPGVPQVDPHSTGELREQIRTGAPRVAPWLAAVRELQQLHRTGEYRIAFFVNMAPERCLDQDRFYNAGTLADDDVLREVLGEGTPVASSARAFLHYRPSQMPGAYGHSMGNANRVKADVLFDFLRANVLPSALAARSQ